MANKKKNQPAKKQGMDKTAWIIAIVGFVVVAIIVAAVVVLIHIQIENPPSDSNIIDHGDHTHVEGVEDDIHEEESTAGNIIDHGDHTHVEGVEDDLHE